MIFSKNIIEIKKYFLIFTIATLIFFGFGVAAAVENFPIVSDSKTSIGLKAIALFNLDKNKVELKLSTKSPKIKLASVRLVVDNYSPVYLSSASSTSFWLDLPSGDHILTISVLDQDQNFSEIATSVFVPHLQSPYIDIYPLTVSRNKLFSIGGQTIYPSKQVVVHLLNRESDKTFIISTDPSGRFSWRGKTDSLDNLEIWSEVLDGSLSSLPSNRIKIENKSEIFYAGANLWKTIQTDIIFSLTLFVLIFIVLITFLLHFFGRNKKGEEELNENNLSVIVSDLRQDVLGHLDLIQDIKMVPKDVALPVLIDLQRTVAIVNKYLENQIKGFSKKTRSVKNKKLSKK